MPIEGLKTRKPTGAVPFPFILLEGEEKAGKSWAIAELTRSERTGTLYWIDLNEGAADEYGAIPGADYEVVELETASYAELLDAIQKIHAEAKRAQAAGEPPVVLAIDSASAIWNALKDWATERAKNTDRNKAILAKNPDAEIDVSANFWNDAGARWRKIQTLLMTFPGIAIVTARGKEVMEMKDGRPVKGSKVWSVECHKELPYSATVWMRMFRDKAPDIIGARSVHTGIKPGSDAPKDVRDPKADGRLLEWLVFDALRCDPAKAHVRDLKEFHAGELMDHEKVDAAAAAEAAAAPAQPQPQQRTSRQRPAQPRSTRTPDEWKQLVADAKIPDQVYKLHRDANAAGQLTQELDRLMRARVEEMGKAAGQQQEQPAAAAPEPTPEPTPEVDEEAARIAAEEAELDAANHRRMLLEELDEQAKIMAASPQQMTHRRIPEGVDAAPTEKLQAVIAGFRGLVITKLRSTGRNDEATAYAKVKPEEYDTVANLFGRDTQADKAA